MRPLLPIFFPFRDGLDVLIDAGAACVTSRAEACATTSHRRGQRARDRDGVQGVRIFVMIGEQQAAGAAAPPTSSATEVATAEVLTPAAGLASLRSDSQALKDPGARSSGDDSKAAHCASRCCRDVASVRDVFLFPTSETVPTLARCDEQCLRKTNGTIDACHLPDSHSRHRPRS